MAGTEELRDRLSRTETYLTDTLLPFWIERSPDREAGGFLSYFDRQGRPTGETVKTFLMQARLLFTFAHASRAGYDRERCLELGGRAAEFLLDHYWDEEHGGWYWIADRAGQPLYTGKIGYGQCFGMYAFGEYFLASGDPRAREAMERTWQVVAERMADPQCGGYFEIMQRDWQPERPGPFGGDRKSFDVHMHMLEALTTVYEVTGQADHRQRLEDVIGILVNKMLDPTHGTGLQQFSYDFTPLPAIRFQGVAWGSDEEIDGGAMPLEITSHGHNVEFIWLLLRAADVLGVPRSDYSSVVRRICDSCVRFGLDDEHGGVYVDGPADGPPTNPNKQFWQQAEVMVGMLDAYSLLGQEDYWRGFVNVHDFVFDRMINFEGGGEWFALCDRSGAPVWDYQGHQWKISYHTVRSMVEVVARLRSLLGEA